MALTLANSSLLQQNIRELQVQKKGEGRKPTCLWPQWCLCCRTEIRHPSLKTNTLFFKALHQVCSMKAFVFIYPHWTHLSLLFSILMHMAVANTILSQTAFWCSLVVTLLMFKRKKRKEFIEQAAIEHVAFFCCACLATSMPVAHTLPKLPVGASTPARIKKMFYWKVVPVGWGASH